MIEIEDAKELEEAVAQLGISLGLRAEREVTMGHRVYGGERKVDVVLSHPETSVRLGIECKYQESEGTAYLKIPSTFDDIYEWEIPGIVVWHGTKFTPAFIDYIRKKGSAIEFAELARWLAVFFEIPEKDIEGAWAKLSLWKLGLRGPRRIVPSLSSRTKGENRAN